jgi:hypothetical protein
MPDQTTTAGPPVPMLELTAVRWLLRELAAGRMDLAAAEDYAGRAAGDARAVLPAAAPTRVLLPGEVPFPLPAADR